MSNDVIAELLKSEIREDFNLGISLLGVSELSDEKKSEIIEQLPHLYSKYLRLNPEVNQVDMGEVKDDIKSFFKKNFLQSTRIIKNNE